MKLFPAFLLVILSGLIGAQAHADADLQLFAKALDEVSKMSPEQVKEELVKELEKVLAPRVRTFSREVVFYHWARRKSGISKSSEFHHPQGEQYIKGVVSRASMSPAAWDELAAKAQDTSNGAAGNGLYLATEPLSTANYGGDDPVVFQVALKPGAKYLDAGDMTFNPTPRMSILLQVFNKSPEIILQSQPHGMGLLGITAIDKTFQTEILPALRKKLGFSALAYQYQTANLPICGKPKGQLRRDVAFVLQDTQAVEWKDTGILVGKPKADDPESLQCSSHIDALTTTGVSFENVQNIVLPVSTLGGSVFPSMAPWSTDLGALKKAVQAAKPKKDTGAAVWARTHLFDCGDYPEDKPLPMVMP